MFAGKRLFKITVIDFQEVNPDLLKVDARYESVEIIVGKECSDIGAIFELFAHNDYPKGTYLVGCEEVFVGTSEIVKTDYLHRHN